MEKKNGQKLTKKSGFTLKDIGSSTIVSFFLYATLKRPQKQRQKTPSTHSAYYLFKIYLMTVRSKVQPTREFSRACLCLSAKDI